ncbi:MAG: hypothetical protein E7256_02105 [Lachnospiraceae bacterium]|nr:hypothetical protein [Lachnospiraceae bacterium]
MSNKKAEKLFESYINEDEYFTHHERQPRFPMERLKKMKSLYTSEQYDEIEDLVFSALSIGERQGFINGITYSSGKNLSL